MTKEATTQPGKHLFALDAMRGMAAILVVCLHEFQAFAGVPHPFSGYLAVDLFFLLSGFVIASAYDQRLAAGMSVAQFIKVRLIRLYPLYLVGLLIGLSRMLVQFQIGANPPPADWFILSSLMEFVMLPSPMTVQWQHDTLFFLNPPAWSLFFELLVNVLFAMTYRHLTQKVLLLLLALSGGCLVYVVSQQGSLEIGNYWHTVVWSAPRVLFPFLLGVWLHRHGPSLPQIRGGWVWLLTMAVVPLLMWHPAGYQEIYDLTMVLLIFPILVLLGASMRTQGITTWSCKKAGDLSYALYIIHMPLFGLMLAVFKRVAPDWPHEIYAGPVCILLVSAFCLALDRYYDKPIRRWLTDNLGAKPALAAEAATVKP